MVNGVNNGNNTSILLQQKQKQLEQVGGQKATDQTNFDEATKKADTAEKTVDTQGKSTAELIEKYNELVKNAPKEPQQPKKADYKTDDDYQKAMADFEKDSKEFEKYQTELTKAEEAKNKAEAELENAKAELEVSNDDKADKDKTLQDTTKEYDKTASEVEDLKKQVEEESQDDKVEVKLTNDKDNNTLVKATINQMKNLQAKGLIDKDLDLNSLSKDQLLKISEAVVSKDINDGTVGADSKLNGTSSDYTKMKAGDSRTYTVKDLQNIAMSIGGKNTQTLDDATKDLPKSVVNDTPSLTISAEELDMLNQSLHPEEVTVHGGDKAPKMNSTPVVFAGDEDVAPSKTVNSNHKSFNTDGTYTYGNKTLDASTVERYTEMEHEMEDADVDIPAHNFEDTEKVYKEFKAKQSETTTSTRTMPKTNDGEVDAEARAKSIKRDQAEDAVMGYSKTSTPTPSLLNSNFDDMLKDKGFDDTFGDRFADFDAKSYAKITAHFRDGARGMYDINGTRFAATQKISESGQKAYLINGEYYALRSDGMPDLENKLKKADFEK